MEDKLVTLAILTYAKAQILKNVLENEGIETYIHNVNQIQPVVSSGVRLRIKESDLPRALKITESSAWLSEEAVKLYKENYIKDYLKDLEPMYAKDEAEKEDSASILAWYSYYKGIESHVQYYKKHLLVYRINYNEYTGGAHGIYMSTFLNMDLRTLSPIRLDDIFVGEYQEALTDLLWNQLMADNKVTTRQEVEDMGYTSTGDLEPTENFYLSPKGITFYYNIYEIAPYVMGPVEITLPYEIMSHLLSDDTMVLNEIRNEN